MKKKIIAVAVALTLAFMVRTGSTQEKMIISEAETAWKAMVADTVHYAGKAQDAGWLAALRNWWKGYDVTTTKYNETTVARIVKNGKLVREEFKRGGWVRQIDYKWVIKGTLDGKPVYFRNKKGKMFRQKE